MRTEHLAPHLSGMCLPYADVPATIFKRVYEAAVGERGLKAYLPKFEEVDFFFLIDEEIDTFVLCVSPSSSNYLPTRGMNTEFLKANRVNKISIFGDLESCVDVTQTPLARSIFENFGFEYGFAVAGRYSTSLDCYSDVAVQQQARAANEAAAIIIKWAKERREMAESSRIFLSHKGANKPLIEKVDAALRLIGLRTWFDKDDLAAGDSLVRGVDNAFTSCSAAVFFISSEYVDAGVIGKEIDRAIHEAATRGGGFRIIPLVLAQHGGTDDRVPDPLKTLVWKTVQDIDVVPMILRSLPSATQAMIRYNPPK